VLTVTVKTAGIPYLSFKDYYNCVNQCLWVVWTFWVMLSNIDNFIVTQLLYSEFLLPPISCLILQSMKKWRFIVYCFCGKCPLTVARLYYNSGFSQPCPTAKRCSESQSIQGTPEILCSRTEPPPPFMGEGSIPISHNMSLYVIG